MNAHTPAPWHVWSNYKGGIPLSIGSQHSEHGNVTIARVDWLTPRTSDQPSEVCKANAAFIVHAVNSHDKLVEACKAAEQLIKEMEFAFDDVPAGVDAWLATARTKLKAALAAESEAK